MTEAERELQENSRAETKFNIDVQNVILSSGLQQPKTRCWCADRVLMLSVKNKKAHLQWAHKHQKWTVEEWKRLLCLTNPGSFLQQADGSIRIWHKSMEPVWCEEYRQWWRCDGVGNVFLAALGLFNRKLTSDEKLEDGSYKLSINRWATVSNCAPTMWSYETGVGEEGDA